mgnify:CR=1 FL=1
MQEVRYLYQPYELIPEADGIVIRSRQLFETSESWKLCWTLEKEGRILRRGTSDVVVNPGEEVKVPCDLALPEEAGEYVRTARLLYKEATSYAEAGRNSALDSRWRRWKRQSRNLAAGQSRKWLKEIFLFRLWEQVFA